MLALRADTQTWTRLPAPAPRLLNTCSWVTGYFNLLGQFAVTAGIDFTFAAFLSTIIMLGTGGAQGGPPA